MSGNHGVWLDPVQGSERADGLHREVWGRGRRLVLAHGFTQNTRCWGPFGHDLATDHQVVAVDLPGHGTTPARYDRADLAAAGRLLLEAGGPAVYLGYSMGGRVALHSALQAAAGTVQALILIGATAGIDIEADRAARRRADAELAWRLETIGLAAFLDLWLANPLFAGLSEQGACRDRRLENRTGGLAASLRCCGTGTQAPLWDQLRALAVPVLVIAGSGDTRFAAIGRRLVDTVPDGELSLLPATHAVHLEQPTATTEVLRTWLDDRLGLI
jgi:2-succinyl-6-hydroxy-2,4-cyclohexadiene-1-carboxylate synthase